MVQHKPNQDSPESQGRGTILVVDDEKTNRVILSRYLKDEGYEVIKAASGQDALAVIKKSHVDVVLLDIMMPGLDGFDVLRRIRSKFTEAEMPVIMVTAVDERQTVIDAFHQGANDYLTKPVDFEVALARIRSQMKLRMTQAALQASEERYALSAKGANDGLWDWDIVEDRIHFSARWKTMLGLDEDADIHTVNDWFRRIHQEDESRVQCELQSHLRGELPHFETQLRMLHEDGSYRWMLCRGMAVRTPLGRATRIAGSLTDITEGKVADGLTGLPNRLLFQDRLKRAIERKKRRETANFAVFYLDLDNFKLINDSLGHESGDQLLVAVARRLEGCVRMTDAVVARIGGDEFTILVDQIDSADSAKEIAERIIDSFSAPFSIGHGRDIFAAASVGVIFSPSDLDSVDDIMRSADTAMYEAKATGRSKYRFYDPQMHQANTARLVVENELRRAVERNEFQLNYQPIVEIRSGKLHSLEALVRWRHPRLGIVGPGRFIEIAEETDMVVPLGRLVMQMACVQVANWRKRFDWCENLRVSINVSRKTFVQPDFAKEVAEILSETDLDPSGLTIEITESTMMANTEEAARRLCQLRDLGVRVSVDDFGTGYSSLSSLHQLPIDVLKIDRSFVDNMVRTSENASIVRTILALADNLNLDVVAEGIETDEQRTSLLAMGCVFGQGFYFSRPLDEQGVDALLAKNTAPPLLFPGAAIVSPNSQLDNGPLN